MEENSSMIAMPFCPKINDTCMGIRCICYELKEDGTMQCSLFKKDIVKR